MWAQVRAIESKWEHRRTSENESEQGQKKWEQVRTSQNKWEQVRTNENKWEQVRPCEHKWWKQVRTCESKWEQVRASEKRREQVRSSENKLEQVRKRENHRDQVRKWEEVRTSEHEREQVATSENKYGSSPPPTFYPASAGLIAIDEVSYGPGVLVLKLWDSDVLRSHIRPTLACTSQCSCLSLSHYQSPILTKNNNDWEHNISVDIRLLLFVMLLGAYEPVLGSLLDSLRHVGLVVLSWLQQQRCQKLKTSLPTWAICIELPHLSKQR